MVSAIFSKVQHKRNLLVVDIGLGNLPHDIIKLSIISHYQDHKDPCPKPLHFENIG
jgi:hypothetical protein